MTHIKKFLLIGLGSLSLAFAFIGLFLPLLPTTPFLLLTAFCYMRSSQRLYDWLLNHPKLGPYLRNYIHHRSIGKRTRLVALSSLWLTILTSAYFAPILFIKIGLIVIASLVTLHLFSLKTL